MSPRSIDDRVLICVESALDSSRIVALLGSLGIEGVSYKDYSELYDQIKRGAAAIIMTEPPDFLGPHSELRSLLYGQPSWSAVPIIMIPNESSNFGILSEDLPVGTTIVERPLRIRTLTSLTRGALHARRNQYIVRDLICEREKLVDLLRHQSTMKNEFLATLAHELRTPLAPIRTG